MKSYLKIALAALVAVMPLTATYALDLPANVQSLADAALADPTNEAALEELKEALEALIEAEGIGSVREIAEALLSEAGSSAQAAVLSEAITYAAVSVAVRTPGANLNTVVAEASQGAVAGAGQYRAAVTQGATAGADAAATDANLSPQVRAGLQSAIAGQIQGQPTKVRPGPKAPGQVELPADNRSIPTGTEG